MTFLNRFIVAGENILAWKRCLGLGKNSFNAEYFFGSKIEIPAPPKRPLSAYMLFCKEKRKELATENPSLKCTEQIKVLAEKWSSLSEEMKKPYELSARKNTQLYSDEHKKFYESLTAEQRNEIARLKSQRLEARRILRLKKELRNSGLPKNPSSAYIMFVQSEAKNVGTINHPTEFIKNVAEAWNSLSDESKKIYEKQADDNKVTFAKEMQAWRTKMISEGKEKLVHAYEDLKRKGKLVDSEISMGKKKVAEKTVKESPVASKK